MAEAVPVTVGTVARQAVPLEISAIGNVQPFTTVAITARVGGQLERVGFREGQDVRKGDVLFEIDRRPYEAALDQARANLERDRARATKAEQDRQALRGARGQGLRDAGAGRPDAGRGVGRPGHAEGG